MYTRVWTVKCSENGFSYVVFVRTTEEKLRDYMKTELPNAVSYCGASEKEISAAKILGLPVYCY